MFMMGRWLQRLGELEALDTVAVRMGALVHRTLRPRFLKNLFSGTWLGHPLHPLMSDLPIGCWSSAVAIDFCGGETLGRASDVLVLLGVMGAVPTAVSGVADWSDTDGEDRRIGFVHGATNVVGLLLFATSMSIPQRRRPIKVGLRLAGLTAVSAGGYLGGHLTFRRGVGVDHTIFDDAPTHWVRIAGESGLEDGRLFAGVADGYEVVVYRKDGRLFAVADRCSHAGASLQEGEVDDDGCIACPLHGSRFRLGDGSVVRGPASAPQPVFDARVMDGYVEVRRSRAC